MDVEEIHKLSNRMNPENRIEVVVVKKTKPRKGKKRGRKPKNQYGMVPKKVVESMDVENHNIIVHLGLSQVQIDECDQKRVKSKMEEPQGYVESNDFFELEPSNSFIPKRDMKELMEERRETMTGAYKVDNTLHHTLLPFYEANKMKSWPKSTTVCCFWCTEPFDGFPIGLPVMMHQGIFYVDGCFCSPECAAAYNFDNTESTLVWERYSLLNLLYTKMINNVTTDIQIAAPRQALKKFGGILSIEEYREFNNNYYKQYKVITPPMISILPSLEKTDSDNHIKKTYGYVPMDEERLKKAKNDLILRRSKPVNNFKNTLENCMGLTIA
tara:strand:+ start:129 stop:1109 length:981 start_codon:yes stop_codon:yes gene_type:complete